MYLPPITIDKNLVLGLVVTSTLALWPSVAMSVTASEPNCYMQSGGKLVDLTRLCGKKDRNPVPQSAGTETTAPNAVPQAAGAENPSAATGKPQVTSPTANNTKVGRIDPNAPDNIRPVLKNKPSELWNSLPNLPSPPVKGPTSP